MVVRKTGLILLILLIPGVLFCVHFSGGSLELFFLSHYGTSTNRADESNVYQELHIGIEGDANRYLKIRSALQTPWMPIHQIEQFDLINWYIQVQYKPYYFLLVQVGDVRVNYSPYTIHTEDYQDNIFKGLMVEYQKKDVYIHSFIGFHSENTNRLAFQDTQYKSDLGYIYRYYDHNGVINEEAAIWGGFFLNYNWQKKNDIRLIYAHENYRLDKSGYGYYFFQNNIFSSECYLNILDWINLKGLYSYYGQSYKAYNGSWDYFGSGKHRLILDYAQLKFYPAYEYGGMITNPLYKKHIVLGTQIGCYYRYIHDQYTPVHMDNGQWQENRGENFLDNIKNNTKGMIYKMIQPLYPILQVGAEYRDFSGVNNNTKHWDSRIFAQFDSLLKVADLLVLYRIQRSKHMTFTGDHHHLDGMYINLSINIVKHWQAGAVFTENKDDVKGYNEFIARVKYYF